MRASGTRPLALGRLALAIALAGGTSLLQAASFELPLPQHVVRVQLSEQLHAAESIGAETLTAYFDFPSGAPTEAPSWFTQGDTVRVVLQPLAPGMPTRAEALVERALPIPSADAPDRPWLLRRRDDGIRVYQQVVQEAWSFRGSDGVRVSVNMPTAPIQQTHLASRRYGDKLEVIYQYGRAHADVRAMDAFVLAQLRRYVRAVTRTAR